MYWGPSGVEIGDGALVTRVLYPNLTFGWKLVVLHTTPSMFGNFYCTCLEVVWTMEVWTKNISYWFIKRQIHFDIPRDAIKMKLALNKSKYVALHSSLHT